VTVSVDGTGTLSTVSGAGLDGTTELRLIGNKMALAGASGRKGSSRHLSASTGISLGAEVSGKLSLTEAELKNLHSGFLDIGRAKAIAAPSPSAAPST
jgi:hypothetical protein